MEVILCSLLTSAKVIQLISGGYSGRGFLGGASGKELSCQCRRHRDAGLSPGLGRSPGGEHGNPLQYSCQENPLDRGVWWAIILRVTKSWARLKQLSTHPLWTVSSVQSLSCVQLFVTP